MKIKRMNRFTRLNVITTIILIGISLLWIYPFIWPIFSAFKNSGEMFKAGWRLWPQVWTLDNFVRAWSKARFNIYLWNSILYAVSSTTLSVFVSALAGYTLARYKFPG